MHVRVFLARYKSGYTCPDCEGSRLRQETKCVLINNKSIMEVSLFTIEEAHGFFKKIIAY